MVSTGFQGGCECENCPSLRIDTDNVEIAAAAEPTTFQQLAEPDSLQAEALRLLAL